MVLFVEPHPGNIRDTPWNTRDSPWNTRDIERKHFTLQTANVTVGLIFERLKCFISFKIHKLWLEKKRNRELGSTKKHTKSGTKKFPWYRVDDKKNTKKKHSFWEKAG